MHTLFLESLVIVYFIFSLFLTGIIGATAVIILFGGISLLFKILRKIIKWFIA